MATKPRQKLGVSATAVALHIDVSQPRVTQLTDEGVFEKLADGSMDLDACRIAYIRWLRDEGRRSSKSASQSRVSDARAREIEMRLAERERLLIPIDDAVAAIDAILGPLPSELAGVPPRVSDDVIARRKIEDELNGVCTEIAKRLRKAGADLRAGRDALASEPTDEPDGVGDKKPELPL